MLASNFQILNNWRGFSNTYGGSVCMGYTDTLMPELNLNSKRQVWG